MLNYRVSYDKLFLSKNSTGGRDYLINGETAIDLALYFTYKVIRKYDEQEVFFSSNQEELFQYNKTEKTYLDQFFRCEIDKENGYKMISNEDLLKKSDYNILFELTGGCVWINDNPKSINSKEAINLLKDYFDVFNNEDNKPTQSTSYSMIEVNTFTNNSLYTDQISDPFAQYSSLYPTGIKNGFIFSTNNNLYNQFEGNKQEIKLFDITKDQFLFNLIEIPDKDFYENHYVYKFISKIVDFLFISIKKDDNSTDLKKDKTNILKNIFYQKIINILSNSSDKFLLEIDTYINSIKTTSELNTSNDFEEKVCFKNMLAVLNEIKDNLIKTTNLNEIDKIKINTKYFSLYHLYYFLKAEIMFGLTKNFEEYDVKMIKELIMLYLVPFSQPLYKELFCTSSQKDKSFYDYITNFVINGELTLIFKFEKTQNALEFIINTLVEKLYLYFHINSDSLENKKYFIFDELNACHKYIAIDNIFTTGRKYGLLGVIINSGYISNHILASTPIRIIQNKENS